jgi:flagellar protein FliS
MFAQFGGFKPGAAYRQVGLETSVAQANPHDLVRMLFDALHSALGLARAAMHRGDIPAKGKQIGIAVRIIEEGLRGALNMQDGGALAKNLMELYDYCVLRLTHANARNDESAVAEVQKLIETVSTSWKAIGAEQQSPQLRAA